MKTIHFVSHTHWDREWYLPYQQFRFRLVKMVDQLLNLLDDGSYIYFTLDGQTIVLDDYLEIRPEEEPRIRRLIQEGKLMIGPWYILPDEFLEGPEAMVRNLLFGRQACRRFTAEPEPMERIGYIPDTFGHIGQLPQIAAGFGQGAICFWRGVGDAPTELRWAAPDGTERLLLHLRDSYSNAAWLGRDEENFAQRLAMQIESLEPHATTSNLLMMFGTDHMAPRPELAERLRAASQELAVRAEQSTLPRYLAAVESELGPAGLARLQARQGEMRSPERAHLLPGVLSTRLYIKQWNARCETVLTRWAEPLSAVAEQLDGSRGRRAFINKAWQWLLQNHPHDSICGCSVDQVHDEMRARFAWSEQIADQVAQSGMETIAGQMDTRPKPDWPALPTNGVTPVAVVFNPTPGTRTGRAQVRMEPAPHVPFDLVDDAGRPTPYRVVNCVNREKFGMRMDREMLAAWLGQIAPSESRINGDWFFQKLRVQVQGTVAFLEILVADGPAGAAPFAELQAAVAQVRALMDSPAIDSFQVRLAEESVLDLELLARNVPGVGYRTYWPVPAAGTREPAAPAPGLAIENEYLSVVADPADGTLTITDKVGGLVLRGANRFVDGGDRGDEYNYTPPENDTLIDRPVAPPIITRADDGLGLELNIQQVYRLPSALAAGDRSRRSDETTDISISSRVRLTPGVRRVEFETTAGNCAEDHRLRVHFPTPVVTDRAFADGHFDVVERSLALPTGTEDWAEQPVTTQPQLAFVDVSDRRQGVMLINRGLPEYEVLPAGPGDEGVQVALTLLRCIGWLSRADLHNRKGHAGPGWATPQAQCQGEHTFHYALVPHSGNYLTVFQEAAAFNAPMRGITTPIHEGRLAACAALVAVSPAAVALSVLKPPENGDGLIVRVYNASTVPIEAHIRLWQPFRQATLVRLDESESLQVLATGSDAVAVPLHGKEIATIRLE